MIQDLGFGVCGLYSIAGYRKPKEDPLIADVVAKTTLKFNRDVTVLMGSHSNLTKKQF